MRLDAGSVAVGVTVGLVTSACVALAVRWAAQREQTAARRRRGQLGRDDPRRDSMNAEACAVAIGPRAARERGAIPVPMMDMASLMGVVLRPPLDERVATMLESTSLCYLSTFSLDKGEPSPHLSLMRFTYVRGEEVVLVSTNRRTKKFAQMCASPSVAVLVHDFADVGRAPDQSGAREPAVALEASEADQLRRRGSLSITLNGTAVIEEGEVAERHRQVHLKANPGYEQFILGEDIAMVAVFVEQARLCNVFDQVQHWAVGGDDVAAAAPVVISPSVSN